MGGVWQLLVVAKVGRSTNGQNVAVHFWWTKRGHGGGSGATDYVHGRC